MRPRVVREKPYLGTDHLFKSDVARGVYMKFIKFGGSLSEEPSIFSVIRFDATFKDTVYASAMNLG